MPSRWRSRFAWFSFIAAMSLTIGCRDRVVPADGDAKAPATGEPDQYSATVVRTVEDGREKNISREARSGEKRREEWSERGLNLALIWRPDLGKSFLLDLDERVYVEVEITGMSESESGVRTARDHAGSRYPEVSNSEDSAIRAIDRYFADTQPPTRIETRILPSTVIDGHSCAVYEYQAFFSDERTETTTRFHASDLAGLVLRCENVADHGSAKVITERRDIRIDVPARTFVVPADFKRVEKLPR